RVIAKDLKRDLALLRLDTLPQGVRALELAPASVREGQSVHTLGNPHPRGALVQDIVLWSYHGGTARPVGFHVDIRHDVVNFRIEAHEIETRMRVGHGNSGGPLVDDEGRVVGVFSGQDEKTGRDYSIDV